MATTLSEVPKSNRKIVDNRKSDISNTQIHDRPLFSYRHFNKTWRISFAFQLIFSCLLFVLTLLLYYLYFLFFCLYWHFYFTLCARLYASVDILLTCVRHLHDRIISLRVEVCAHKTNLTPPRFIEVIYLTRYIMSFDSHFNLQVK
jgi:hypothetical protein